MGFRYQYLRGKLPENSAYGHSRILSDYCSASSILPVFGRIQHGWGEGTYWDDDRIPSFVWNQTIVEFAKTAGYKKYYAIGAPFIYLEFSEPVVYPDRKKTSLIVLAHSTFNGKERFKLDEIKSVIARLAGFANYDPVFMFYHKDLTMEIKEYLTITEIAYISAGDGIYGLNRDDFLRRITQIILSSEEIILQEVGSMLFYSAFHKKKTNLITREDKSYIPASELEIIIASSNLSISDMFDISKRELGFSHKKSAEELVRLFSSAPISSRNQARKNFAGESARNFMNKLENSFPYRKKMSG